MTPKLAPSIFQTTMQEFFGNKQLPPELLAEATKTQKEEVMTLRCRNVHEGEPHRHYKRGQTFLPKIRGLELNQCKTLRSQNANFLKICIQCCWVFWLYKIKLQFFWQIYVITRKKEQKFGKNLDFYVPFGQTFWRPREGTRAKTQILERFVSVLSCQILPDQQCASQII